MRQARLVAYRECLRTGGVANAEVFADALEKALQRREEPDMSDVSMGTVLDAVNMIGERLTAFEKRVDERFDSVDRRFDAVDRRFEAVDKRFEAVEKRLAGVEERQSQAAVDVQKSMTALSTDLEKRLKGLEEKQNQAVADIQRSTSALSADLEKKQTQGIIDIQKSMTALGLDLMKTMNNQIWKAVGIPLGIIGVVTVLLSFSSKISHWIG